MTQYLCISIPFFIGEKLPNRNETQLLKESGIAAELNAPWIDLEADFFATDNPIVAVNRALVRILEQYPAHIPIVFSADCVNALGMVKGLNKPDLRVIWFDAHGDFNTPETTPSGFLGGMPLAMLVGRGDLSLVHEIGTPIVPEANVIITDARDLDPQEAVALHESNLTHIPDIKALLNTDLPEGPVYLHFDTDVVDPEFMNGMGYPAPGGPSLEVALNALRHVSSATNPVGILFSLWDQSLADDNRALEGTLHLTRAFVEGMRLGGR